MLLSDKKIITLVSFLTHPSPLIKTKVTKIENVCDVFVSTYDYEGKSR